MLRDALGREIQVGDIVVKGRFGGYAEINLAEVIGLTEKSVRLVFLDKNFDKIQLRRWDKPYTISSPESVLVINETVITLKQARAAGQLPILESGNKYSL